MNLYHFCTEILGHEGPVRAIDSKVDGVLSGSQDSSARFWSVFESAGEIQSQESQILTNHSHWVTSVAFIPQSGGYVTGSLDKMIRIYDSSGNLVHKVQGHEGGVISLAFTRDNLLVSGSWDGTARIWNIDAEPEPVEMAVLRGHENGVTVLCTPDDRILTTSTGYQADDVIVDFKIREFSRIDGNWRETKQVSDHAGPIRKLTALFDLGFIISCSNDGYIHVRDSESLQTSFKLMHSPSQVNNDNNNLPFVLDVTATMTSDGPIIVSVGEDGSVLVWRFDGNDWSIFDRIFHPCSVWCSCIQPETGNIITGGHDNIIRVFSNHLTNMPSETVLTAFSNQVADHTSSSSSSSQLSQQEKDRLRPWSLSHHHGGLTNGEIRMFLADDGESIIAGRWDDGNQVWINVGNVTGVGAKGRKHAGDDGFRSGKVHGIDYDIIFDIELPSSTGSTTTVPCGMNRGENPYVVAQRFVDEYELSLSYRRQISDYIYKKLESTNIITRLVGDVSRPTGNAMQLDHAPSSVVRSVQPVTYIDVKACTNIMAKLSSLYKDDNINALGPLVELCADASHYHSHPLIGNIQDVQLTCLLLLTSSSSLANLFPLIDLLRLVAIHLNQMSIIINPFTHQLFNSSYHLAKYSTVFGAIIDRLSRLTHLDVSSTSFSLLDIIILLFRDEVDLFLVAPTTQLVLFRLFANIISSAISSSSTSSSLSDMILARGRVGIIDVMVALSSSSITTSSAVACIYNAVILLMANHHRTDLFDVASDVMKRLTGFLIDFDPNQLKDAKVKDSVMQVLTSMKMMIKDIKSAGNARFINVFRQGCLPVNVQQALARMSDSSTDMVDLCDEVSSLIAECVC